MSGEREWWQHEDTGATRRLRSCVEAWPDCQEGDYNPSCCRFPKSCSATVYEPEGLHDADLEPKRWAPHDQPKAAPQADGLSEEECEALARELRSRCLDDGKVIATDAEHDAAMTGGARDETLCWTAARHVVPAAPPVTVLAVQSVVECILADRLAARDRDHEAEVQRRLGEQREGIARECETWGEIAARAERHSDATRWCEAASVARTHRSDQ